LKFDALKMMRSTKKFVAVPALALLFIFMATACVAVANVQTQPPAQDATSPESQISAPKAEPDTPVKRQHPEGIARQLAHESNEAAGEEKDETAAFKQSAPVRWIAEKTGLTLQHAYWLCVILNFAVIGIVLLQVGWKHLPGAFRNRSASIQRSMQEAQKASEEARRKLAEIESRLMKLDVEIGRMRDSAEAEAAAEEVRIKAAAEEDARKIIESAEQEIAAAAKAARRELTAYAADLAVGLAKKQIHVDAATDESLVNNFAGQLTSSVSGPGKGAK
jgi:F-type H+-transporting ATPase subunit b